jgi:hypothetical protein
MESLYLQSIRVVQSPPVDRTIWMCEFHAYHINFHPFIFLVLLRFSIPNNVG